MNEKLTFKISIPTDEGFVGRACNNSECGQYFKIYAESIKDVMFCPYCGYEFPSSELMTSDQLKYGTKVAKEEAFVYMQKHL